MRKETDLSQTQSLVTQEKTVKYLKINKEHCKSFEITEGFFSNRLFYYREYFFVIFFLTCCVFLVPLEAPMDVGVVLMNSTTIKVTWAAVDKKTVRGHLLGYKVLIPYLLCFLA